MKYVNINIHDDSLENHIAWKFDNHIGSSAAEVPGKFHSDPAIINTNLISGLWHFARSYDKTSNRILKRGHGCFMI